MIGRLFCLIAHAWEFRGEHETVPHTRYPDMLSERRITIECARCAERRAYIGSSTVWNDAATGCRAGTMLESFLADVEWHIKRKEVDAREPAHD